MSKKYKALPVHVVEYHNDALEHIYRAIGSKHLPMGGVAMLHYDAHPDMIIPDISAEVVFCKKDLYNSLSIENWIMPALYAGHIDSVMWLKADWARQIQDGRYKFKIGRHFGSSKIRVTCSDDYFLSECLYAPENELQDVKDVDFHVQTCGRDFDEKNAEEIGHFLGQKPYILDIDLDFFSTKNPVKEAFSAEDYKLLKSIYEFESPTSRTDSDLKSCLMEREKMLCDLKQMLVDIEEDKNCERWTGLTSYSELKLLYGRVRQYPSDEIDANLLHEFGCTCDDPELPHHVSTDAEIDDLVISMETHLKLVGRPPTLVTVSRSAVDEYCPPDQVDKIQLRVERTLEKLYGNIKVFYHYMENT